MRWLIVCLCLASLALAACAASPAATPSPPSATSPPSPTGAPNAAAAPSATPRPTAASATPVPASFGATTPPAAAAPPTPTRPPIATPTELPRAVVGLRRADGSLLEVKVEVARDVASRQRGLMFRTSLPADAGMLFVFPDDTDGPFWMKDTNVPLSIAFIGAEGRIVSIKDMTPLSTDLTLPGARYRYALEVNQGFFGRGGVRVGDRAELPRLAGAVAAGGTGFEPVTEL